MDYVKAFLTGGAVCALVQILMEKTKMMPGRIMVLLVTSGCLLGALGLYEPFLSWAGAGASVPLLGVWKSAVERRQGGGAGIRPAGVFRGGLTAGAAGICAALVFGYLASLIFKPKMK